MLELPRVDKLAPRRPNARTLKALPIFVDSIIKSFMHEPRCTIPATEAAEPNLEKARTLRPEPTVPIPSIETAAPQRVKLRMESELPHRT
jgi:hypothetical protein